MTVILIFVAVIASIVGGTMGGVVMLLDAQAVIGAVQALILLVTGWIVWQYTLAAQVSNEIQERPILNLYLREEKVGSNIQRQFRIRNIGNGPAYNVRLESIPCDDGHVYQFELHEPNSILEGGGDEKTMSASVKKPGRGVEIYDEILGLSGLFRRCFLDRSEDQKRIGAVFVLNCESISGQSYYSIFRVYPQLNILLTASTLYPIVEFVQNGKSVVSHKEAVRICSSKPMA